MLRKKCDGCQRVAWFWQSGWYTQTMDEARQEEANNPYLQQSIANLGRQGVVWETRPRTVCPKCLNDERGYFPATGPRPCGKCGKCGKAVSTNLAPRPHWYDAGQFGWVCTSCMAVSCGECATPKVQQLKAKYSKAGADLKRAIDNDASALYELRELAPRCALCDKRPMWVYGEVGPA